MLANGCTFGIDQNLTPQSKEEEQRLRSQYSHEFTSIFKGAMEQSKLLGTFDAGYNLKFFKRSTNGKHLFLISLVCYAHFNALCRVLLTANNGDIKNKIIPKEHVKEAVGLFTRVAFDNMRSVSTYKRLPDFQLVVNHWLSKYKIKYDVSCKTLKKHCRKILELFLEFLALQMKVTILSNKFRIDSLELIKRNLNVKDYSQLSPTFDSIQYVFSQLDEEKLKKIIFDSPTNDSVSSTAILEELGYTSVHHPQKEDLILYFDKQNRHTHIGIFFDDKTIYSKWNRVLPQIFAHPIEVVPLFYGDRYVILRKNVNQSSLNP